MSPRETEMLRSGAFPQLEIKPKRVGTPRLDPYHRLLSRFYEPLVLLRVLGKSGGDSTPKPVDLDAVQATRRRVLRNLSYICDFDRGGDTCTAIGLEDLETSYRFWVASNKGNNKIVKFLELALASLRNIDNPLEEFAPKAAEFSRFCIDFSTSRINKEKKCLFAAIYGCLQQLSHQNTERGNCFLSSVPYLALFDLVVAEQLGEWLGSLLSHVDNFHLCTFAYEIRHSEFVLQLQNLSAKQERMVGPRRDFQSFASARHLLGRLAHHIRASIELFEDATDVSYILQTFDVRAIEPMQCVPPPATDTHTHLDGILHRMLGKNCNERPEVERGLIKINAVKGTFSAFMSDYRRIRPRVHAEVQVLEHFHNNKMAFAGNDRYVACSKPACLLCEMYFRYHPARMAVPESHRNIWANWGPPFVENYSKENPAGRRQLDILNVIIRELREMVVKQALGHPLVGHWHPDSNTGITELHSSGHILMRNQPQGEPLVTSVGASVVEQQQTESDSDGQSTGFGQSRDMDEDPDLESGGVSICNELG